METWETWKDVAGYENKYQVNNFGHIKSLLRKGKILKNSVLSKTGYLCVDLCYNGKITKHTIHRLVAKAFIPNPENKEQVNHINGVKKDNRVINLEWSTRSENQLHSIRIGLRTTKGEKNSQSKLSSDDVLHILESKEKYNILSKKYNISISTISDIKRGYSWTHITGLYNKKINGKTVYTKIK
jgi:hypothetical protein